MEPTKLVSSYQSDREILDMMMDQAKFKLSQSTAQQWTSAYDALVCLDKKLISATALTEYFLASSRNEKHHLLLHKSFRGLSSYLTRAKDFLTKIH